MPVSEPVHSKELASDDEQDELATGDEVDDDEHVIQGILEEFEQQRLENSKLPALPAHLKLPAELEHRILDFGEDWHELWIARRLVSKSWCEHVEFLARRRWLPTAAIHYPNGFDWTDSGRIVLDATLAFQSVRDDGTAVFEDKTGANEFRELIGQCCGTIDHPDIILDNRYLFDVPINSLDFSDLEEHLRVTVNWRVLISAVLVEHDAVDKERARLAAERRTNTVALRLKVERGEIDMMHAMLKLEESVNAARDEAYTTVRRRRFGEDRKAEKRLSEARTNMAYNRLLVDGLEEDEAEDEDDSEDEESKKWRITFDDDDGDEDEDEDGDEDDA